MTCDYCGLATDHGARFHEMCELEADDSPLLAPLHTCPDSGTYPCECCSPSEVAA